MNDKFGRVLRNHRDDAGLKQSEVAARVGVSQGTVSEWERGKRWPEADQVQKLAVIFNVPYKYLVVQQFGLASDVENAILADAAMTRKEQDALLAHYAAVTSRDSTTVAALLRGEGPKAVSARS
ncbi:XRE family transcriptional regulator [Actinomadura darangshiensis]|uniref:XRE family transcriptional regulator n=1 Tax=Actinomadura darangshiensis TaxID=705336 RepID=A0A4R5BNB6_9ACTN|nr:helix-turn-helix transcriptional regulator [Actinomadura darangshiensis]TDD87369.1 XRE family transcriptional regulator [Actinomadura darangshiensis]